MCSLQSAATAVKGDVSFTRKVNEWVILGFGDSAFHLWSVAWIQARFKGLQFIAIRISFSARVGMNWWSSSSWVHVYTLQTSTVMSEFFTITIKMTSQPVIVCRSNYVDPSQLESSYILTPSYPSSWPKLGETGSGEHLLWFEIGGKWTEVLRAGQSGIFH